MTPDQQSIDLAQAKADLARAEHSLAELRRLFTESCGKLGMTCAELGIAGDEPAAVLKAKARQIMQERTSLLGASSRLVKGAQAALGGHYMVPAGVMGDLARLVSAAEAPPKD